MVLRSLPFGVFMGTPDRLDAAYPPALRGKISGHLNIMGADIPGNNWAGDLGALGQAEVIMSTWGMPRLTREFLAAAQELKAVFYAAGSIKGFATEEAYERGIQIISARMANAVPVAEYAAAVVALSLKRFWSYSQLTREKRVWERTIPVAGTYHSTVGLVSLGATGRQTAERLCRLDCHLIAFDPFLPPDEVDELGIKMVSLDDVFRLSDVVSVHAPLLPQTRGMINGRLLALMKTGATLVNTSRGAVIVESDLCRVLESRPDLTAVLDVTDPEPPAPESPLFTLPNVVLTPHISGSMGKEIEMMGRLMYEELIKYFSNRPLSHSVSRELLSQIA